VQAQLVISTDRGAHWQVYKSAATTDKQFMFRAGGDGEYWFAIRTVDRSGRARPPMVSGPGLRVLVDTKQPVLKLSAEQDRDGQVAADGQRTGPPRAGRHKAACVEAVGRAGS
jgi:hypothetical protein